MNSFFNVERSQIRKEAAIQIHYSQAGGITGHVMLLCMLLMYTTAHARIRKQSFETFWYTHHLFIPFLLGMYVHATGCFVRDTPTPYSPFAGKQFWEHCIGYEGWRWELVAGALYLTERIYREIRARRETQIIKVIRHPFGELLADSSASPLSSILHLLILEYRNHGDSIPKGKHAIQSRPMAIPQLPYSIRTTMASLYYHVMSLRPIH